MCSAKPSSGGVIDDVRGRGSTCSVVGVRDIRLCHRSPCPAVKHGDRRPPADVCPWRQRATSGSGAMSGKHRLPVRCPPRRFTPLPSSPRVPAAARWRSSKRTADRTRCGSRHLQGIARVARCASSRRLSVAKRRSATAISRTDAACGMSHGACGRTCPVSSSDLRLDSTAAHPPAACVALGLVGEVLVGDGEPDDLRRAARCRTSPGTGRRPAPRRARPRWSPAASAATLSTHRADDVGDAGAVGALVLPARSRPASPTRCCGPSTRRSGRRRSGRARPSPACSRCR